LPYFWGGFAIFLMAFWHIFDGFCQILYFSVKLIGIKYIHC
jgi:hypothetical protein